MERIVAMRAVMPLTRPVRLRKFRSSTVKYWQTWGTSSSRIAAASRAGTPSRLSSCARMASRPSPKPQPMESTMWMNRSGNCSISSCAALTAAR